MEETISISKTELDKLRQDKELLFAIVDAIPEPIVAKNWEGNFIFANKAVANLYNTQPEAMIGHDDGYFTGNQEQADFFKKNVQEIMAKFEPERVYEDSTDAKTGEVRHFHSLKIPFKDHNGDLNISVIAKDITEVVRAKKQVEEKERQLSYVLESTQDGIWDWDVVTGIVKHNEQWGYLSGLHQLETSMEEFLGCIHPQDREEVQAKVEQAVADDKPYICQFRMLHPSGKVVWVEDRGRVVERKPDGSPIRMVGAAHDITEQVAQKKRIEQLAFYDPLTHLPNRRLFDDRLQQAIIHHKKIQSYGAVLFLDLDHFKVLNDVHGHYMGDQLLTEIAKRLPNCIKSDDTVARFGGDEFVIILNELEKDPTKAAIYASNIAQQLRTEVAKPAVLINETTETSLVYEVTTSIGAVIFPAESEEADQLVQLADMALYRAKDDGRDAFVAFKADMQDSLDYSLLLQRDLKKAIHKQQLELYYQPKYDHHLQLIGAEALVRWNSPERGLVMPGEFIDIAEESSLIIPLGNWVLERACQQLMQWQSQPNYSHLSISVNVSAKQVWQNDFVESVQAIIGQYDFDPGLLTLEITESLMVRDLNSTINKLNLLKQCGLHISLDDFGTGYSSLSYLKRLPVDEIKIDASFVRDIVVDPSDYMMTKAIIDIGHNFEVDVIAEGVETEAHMNCLHSLGVSAYQGYLFSKPVTLSEFAALPHSHTPK